MKSPFRVSVRQGFTLIELLIVIAIMALMMGLAVPAFNGITRGSSMQSAVAQLRATISLARQWAITHRTDTYVVFPDGLASLYVGSEATGTNKALRSFNVYTQPDGYLGDWKFLPQGIVLSTTNLAGITSGSVNVLNRSANDVTFPVIFGAATTTVMCCVGFTPDGRLKQNGATQVSVFLTEGTIEPGYTVLARGTGTGAQLKLFPLTGQVKVIR